MQQPLDVVSWDSYPRFHNDEESFSDTMTENAFDHAMIRCLKKRAAVYAHGERAGAGQLASV